MPSLPSWHRVRADLTRPRTSTGCTCCSATGSCSPTCPSPTCVLWLPLSRRREGGFLAAAQMRPTTGPTVHHDDIVGTMAPRGRRPQLDTAFDEGRICRERDPDWPGNVPVREETIPVVRAGRVIAVVSRHTDLAAARTPSRLELTYLRTADDLALMIAAGALPDRRRRAPSAGAPAGRGRADPPRRRRGRDVRQPERALGLPPARPDRRPAGTHLGDVTADLAAADAAGRRGAVDGGQRLGGAARGRGRGGGDDGAAAGDPAGPRRGADGGARCCAATSPSCAAGSASWSARTRRSARSTTG